MNIMEQKILKIESTEDVNKVVSKMNKDGFRLVSMDTIPAKHCPPDAHGVSYSTNEQIQLLFEKP